MNPIALLTAMSRDDAIALVPLVYGYVNYAGPLTGRHTVSFADAPLALPGGRRGSVLGGTGHCDHAAGQSRTKRCSTICAG